MAGQSSGQGPRLVMSADDVRRAITRIGHEIVERNHGIDGVVLVGLQRGGVWIAQQLQASIARIEVAARDTAAPTAGQAAGQADVPLGILDVSFYRDDVGIRPIVPGRVTDIPITLDGANVVLVDDVLFTGRTVRAALDALNDHGRPRTVQLAVIVDRGHRELPIRPDYVGKNLPTSRHENVSVTPEGVELA